MVEEALGQFPVVAIVGPAAGRQDDVSGVSDLEHLLGHPVLGASWEGFAIEQVLASRPWDEASFYRTAAGAEIDLITRRRGGRGWPSRPRTRSIRQATALG